MQPVQLDCGSTACLRQVSAEIQARRFRRAIKLCNVGLNRTPPRELERMLRLERARALLAVRQWTRAELDCRRALEHECDAQAHTLLARALFEQKRTREASCQAEAALGLDDTQADDWQLYAQALSAEKRHDAAVHAAEQACLHDGSPGKRLTLLRVLAAAGRHEQTLRLAEAALESRPHDAELCAIVGVSASALGRWESAVAAFRRALALEPDRVDANCGLAFMLLRLGYFEEGFRHNEYRQKNSGACRRLGIPPWNGELLTAKHLLVWCEQGMGDIVQFARFMQIARARAERTTLIVPSALVSLLRSNPALGSIQAEHPGFAAADYQCLVMSLPHHLKLGKNIDSGAVPYLFAEPDRLEHWRARLPRGPKVALVWQGNPNYAGDRWRSMPFAHFGPLLQRFSRETSFLSLQKYYGREQLDGSPFAQAVHDLSEHIDSQGSAFVDSLAVLSLVDLFITTDSSIAHVAGAAGIPTWLLLGQDADWRWGINDESTAWYPSMRLFRQANAEGWPGVIDRVVAELTTFDLRRHRR